MMLHESVKEDLTHYCLLTCVLICSHPLTGAGNGNPLQYSCLENPMDGGAW